MTMTTLTLLFQTGFNKDSVNIQIGKESRSFNDLETDYSIGLARKVVLHPERSGSHFKLVCSNDMNNLEFTLPHDGEHFVLIELDEQKHLQVEVTQRPPIYF